MLYDPWRMESTHTKPRRRAPWWVVSTYFAEGLPYALVRLVSTPFFKDNGASLEAIGLTSLYGLPWNLKFLWAPAVDTTATKRRWLIGAEAALAGLSLAQAVVSGTSSPLGAASVLFLLMAIAAATNDISIDGYYLEALDRTEQARWVGFQMMAYRIALISGGGGLIFFSGIASWTAAWVLAAAVLGGLALLHTAFLPRIETRGRRLGEALRGLLKPVFLVPFLGAAALVLGVRFVLAAPWAAGARAVLGRLSMPQWIVLLLLVSLAVLAVRAPALKRKLYASDSSYALAFIDYLDQPRIGVILAFIALYRTGESFLLNMAYPFLRDIGVTRAQYGIAYGTFGITAAIVGGMLGGILIARYGLRRCVWPFVLCQNALNLLYMAMAIKYRAVFQHPELGSADIRLVTGLIVVEAFGAGLGSSAFQVFIMRTTKASFKAAHMAIATALMSVSATAAGVASGFLAHALGFSIYFGLTFLGTVPAMILIPFVPQLKEGPAPRT